VGSSRIGFSGGGSRGGRRGPLWTFVGILLLPVALFLVRDYLLSDSESYRRWEASLSEASTRPFTDAERTEIQRLLDEARTRAKAAQEAWRAGIKAAAEGNVGERSDLGECPVQVAMPSAKEGVAPPWMHQIKANELSTAGCKWMLSFDDAATEIERKLRSGGEPEGAGSALDDARKLDAIRPLWDVTFVVDSEIKPVVHSGELGEGWRYKPGEVAGEAYLYDYRAEKVVCAGYVRAQNSEMVKFETDVLIVGAQPGGPATTITTGGQVKFDDAVRRDLRIATHRGVAGSLRLRTGSW